MNAHEMAGARDLFHPVTLVAQADARERVPTEELL
jgi:hypothetical protein